jgi:hypothetical protein
MTPMTTPCTMSVLQRGLSQLLAIFVLAIAAGSAGCTNARHGDGTSGGRASTEPDAWKLPFSNEELQVLATHISPTLSAEFTADGKWIVVAGTDGVTIHDAASTNAVNWFNAALGRSFARRRLTARQTPERRTRVAVDPGRQARLAAAGRYRDLADALQRRCPVHRLWRSRVAADRRPTSRLSRAERATDSTRSTGATTTEILLIVRYRTTRMTSEQRS